MLEICTPRPGMRFSSHLLLSFDWLTGDCGADVAPQSIEFPKPWRHPVCNTSRTNWGKITQTSQSYLQFTLCSLFWSRTKVFLLQVFATKYVRSVISDGARNKKKLETSRQSLYKLLYSLFYAYCMPGSWIGTLLPVWSSKQSYKGGI